MGNFSRLWLLQYRSMYRQKEIGSRNTRGIGGHFGKREKKRKKEKKGTLNFPISLTTMNVSPSGDPRGRVERLTKGSFCQRIDFYGQPTTLNKKEKKKRQKRIDTRKEKRRRRKKESKGKKEKDHR
ncbi:unnamed protein product [Tuber aestivum]|uniref:Uncharacterized protein n=1 Tax=Tuber aestivum TaxID=59557 RepID=A0A292PL21_9PEZI|nr:unnamed protein product [Tuber aestivum]